MNRNTKFNLSAKVILLAATFFSATAFAATCPQPQEIHFDNTTRQFIAQYGWTSTERPRHLQVGEFISATITPDSPRYPTTGEIECHYGNSDDPEMRVTMTLPNTTVIAGNNFTVTRETGYEEDGNYVATQMQCTSSAEACEFITIL